MSQRAALRTAFQQTCTRQGLAADLDPRVTLRWALDDLDAPTAAPETLGPAGPAGFDQEVVSDLKVGDLIGRGGMGQVRRADQRSIGRQVAVKLLLPQARGSLSTRALLHEARIAGRLEHPNVVPVHALAWTDEDGPVLVMKHIEGELWRDQLQSAGPGGARGEALERALEILQEVCQALHFAHSRGVLHRDVKPDNVMIGAFGEVTLLDWGIAVELDGEGRALTGERLVGTPAYMAPEMTRADAALDVRTDVYLLGACLHEILTGRPRHRGEDLPALLADAALSEPVAFGEDLPRELAAICNRACAAAPEARYPDVAAFREAVALYLRHRGAVAAARAASERLARLREALGEEERGAEHTLRVHRLFSACRFGFEQALADWPESPEAGEGLQAALEAMIGFELDADNHRSAALLMADLREPRPALAARLEAVQAAAAAREEASARLEALRQDQRFVGLDWGRSAVTLLNGAITCPVLLLVDRYIQDHGPPALAQNAAFVAICGVLIAAGIPPFRRFVLDSALYGRLMFVLASLAPLLLVNRLLAWRLDIPFEHLLAMDCMIFVALALTVAQTLARAFYGSALIALAGTVTVALVPGRAVAVIGLAYLANSLWLAWVLRPGASSWED
jgi:hypothetical protein